MLTEIISDWIIIVATFHNVLRKFGCLYGTCKFPSYFFYVIKFIVSNFDSIRFKAVWLLHGVQS